MSIMFLTSALSRLIAIHIKDLNVLLITLAAFSVWPTFDDSRTWFGGAFWLTMPVATLLVSIILVKEIVADRSPDKNSFLLIIFSFVTVFISSQVLLPIIFIYAYLLPYFLFEESKNDVKKYILRITLISAAPSVITFFARPQLPAKHADFYGLIDGSILRNAFYFIENKIFFMDKPSYTFNFSIFVFVVFSCSKSSDVITPAASANVEVPAVYKKIYGASSVTSDGTYITIKTKGLPDHKSAYYATTNSLYQAYSGTTFGGLTFAKNPNTIIEQSGTFKIPLKPVMSTNHAATPLGAIGIALNGVPFFNQYAGPNNQELKGEMAGFDQFYGHPQNSGVYHYHVEPLQLTTVKSTKSGLMGFLLDGFPVYGPQEESGSAVTNANLDVYHGHSHATVDYPNGIYHYHFTTEAPYLNGNGFYGTPGTVTQ